MRLPRPNARRRLRNSRSWLVCCSTASIVGRCSRVEFNSTCAPDVQFQNFDAHMPLAPRSSPHMPWILSAYLCTGLRELYTQPRECDVCTCTEFTAFHTCYGLLEAAYLGPHGLHAAAALVSGQRIH